MIFIGHVTYIKRPGPTYICMQHGRPDVIYTKANVKMEFSNTKCTGTLGVKATPFRFEPIGAIGRSHACDRQSIKIC